MLRLAILIVCAIVSFVTAAEEVGLPSSIRICNSNAADYNECLKVAIQNAMPLVCKGIPELDLPPLDPYVIDNIDTKYSNGVIRGQVISRNARTYGISGIKILGVRSTHQQDRYRLEIDLFLPKILVEGDYKADGKFEHFPVGFGGKGKFNISMEGVKTTWDMQGIVQDDRFVVQQFHMFPQVDSMKVGFDDLFNGNQVINNLALTFVNQYWSVLYQAMLPNTEKQWNIHLTELSNRVFSKISYAKTFP